MKLNPCYKDNLRMAEFVRSLPRRFDAEGTVLYAGRNIIKSFVPDGERVVVKRFRLPVLPQRVIYSFFRKSKAERAFRNGGVLLQRGISTPLNIACLEEWEHGLFKYGYYVTDYDDASPIRERLIDPENFDRDLADAFAAFAAQLHRKGILDHDLNSTNVLYRRQEDGGYTFSLIDINRMDILPLGKCPSPKQCMENLTRFTGHLNVYEYVLRQYAACRGWDADETVRRARTVKLRHDKRTRRRKIFFRRFKRE